MQEMKDVQIEGFKKTLDPVTVDYLEEKLEKTNRVDLRKITERAANELQKLENEAAYDYLKIEKETKILISEIQQSDQILSNLEDLLQTFRENLSVIKGEMTNLQDQSMKMNIGLNNRKKLSNEFSEFIESIMLEPKLIEDILKGDINEEYVQHISKLFQKLNNLKKYDSIDNKSIKEIEPELNKLKMKACDRIKDYMSEQINRLKVPKTNIQIIQQNNLINYRIFFYFLKEFNQKIYYQLSQNYSKILSGVYYDNFKTYTDDLNKLLDSQYNEEYNLFPVLAEFNKQNFRTYRIGNRCKILNQNEDYLIIAHYESQANKKFFIEEVFQSLNKLFVATIVQEYTFCQNFFCLTNEENLVFYATIFKKSVQFVINKIKNWISYAQDVYGILLMSCIILKTKQDLQQRKIIALDHYFNQLEAELWSKLDLLFKKLIQKTENFDPRISKQILLEVKEDNFYQRSINIITGLTVIDSSLNTNSFQLSKNIKIITDLIVSNIEKIAKEALIEKEIISISINSFYCFVKGLKSNDQISQQIIYNVETKLNDMIDRIIDKLFEEYFEKICNFLKRNKNNEINLKYVEDTNNDFYNNWNLKLANMKNEIEYKFSKFEIQQKILKKVTKNLLEIYEQFFSLVKDVYPTYSQNLYPVHKLNVEIKKIINNQFLIYNAGRGRNN